MPANQQPTWVPPTPGASLPSTPLKAAPPLPVAPPPPTLAAAAAAAPARPVTVAPATHAEIKARLQMAHPASRANTEARKEVRAYKETAATSTPPFPTNIVAAAVAATDVLMPADMERRVLMITEMYLRGATHQMIAKQLDLPENVVLSEVRRIEHHRATAFAKTPGLAEDVVGVHYDVLKESVKMIQNGEAILAAVAEELLSDHTTRKIADMRGDPYAGKMGISPHKLQAYFLGVEAIGKQKDRVANIQGLLDRHAPPPGSVINTTNNTTVVFAEPQLNKLNSMVNHLMTQAGHSVIGGELAIEEAKRVAQYQIEAVVASDTPNGLPGTVIDVVATRNED